MGWSSSEYETDGSESTERFIRVLDRLAPVYADAPTLLTYRSPFQLLISVILSAQTTDEQVNRVTPRLFEVYGTPEVLAQADEMVVEEIIRSLGYFRAKTKHIIGAARILVDRFNGAVPATMDELLTIPGTGRKTAGVILHNLFNKPAIIVDTHFGRVCRRLGFVGAKNPTIVEREIAEILPEKLWGIASMRLNHHGRRYCMARKPNCPECPIRNLCPRHGV